MFVSFIILIAIIILILITITTGPGNSSSGIPRLAVEIGLTALWMTHSHKSKGSIKSDVIRTSSSSMIPLVRYLQGAPIRSTPLQSIADNSSTV